MLKYVLQEMPEMRDGHKKIYPKLLSAGLIGNEKIVNRYQSTGTANRYVAELVLKSLPDIIEAYLTEGHSVKVDGLGTFSLSLEFGDEKPDELTAGGSEEGYRHVRVKDINFRPDKDFLRLVQANAEFERGESHVIRVSKPKYTPAERLSRLQNYLQGHESITLSQYCTLNKLSRAAASQELKRFSLDPDSGVVPRGSGSHKVWVRGK
jgi:predicted histone-like DNA-binding protein